MNNSFESFELSTELIFQRFLMDKERRKNFYNGLELADYIALKVMEKDCIDGKDKTYLKDLSSFMRISIPQTSAIASILRTWAMLYGNMMAKEQMVHISYSLMPEGIS